MVAEPPNGFFQRDFWWCLRKTQFPNRFGAVVVHLVFSHFDAFKRNAGRPTRQVGDPVIGIGEGQNSRSWQLDAWRRDAGETAEDLKYFAEHQVFVAQNIPFAL